MKKIRSILMNRFLVGTVLATANTVAFAQPAGVDMNAALSEAKKATQIENITTIPISSLRAIESDGQIHYVSENGRYVITGRLIDVLQRKPLDTVSQIEDSVNRLCFGQLRMDIDPLNPVTIGNG